MPEKKTTQRARRDRRQGKKASTQAGNYVGEEMRHKKSGKHKVKSRKQAVAIGLSKARRAGVKVPKKGSSTKRSSTKSSSAKGSSTRRSTSARKPTAKRSTRKTTRRTGTSGKTGRKSTGRSKASSGARRTKKSGSTRSKRSNRS